MISKIIAFIPARSGSKRIKDKNIYPLNGKPLIAYTLEYAINSGYFDKIFIVTDSKLYAETALRYGEADILLRPKSTAGDNSPDIDWVRWSLNQLSSNESNTDLFCILRPTNPFRDKSMLEEAIEFMKNDNNKNFDSVRAVELCKQHPYKMWLLENNNKNMQPLFDINLKNNPAHSCQYASLPKIYVQNASLDLCRTSNILKYNSISGNSIHPLITKGYSGFDINFPEDIIAAVEILKNSLN